MTWNLVWSLPLPHMIRFVYLLDTSRHGLCVAQVIINVINFPSVGSDDTCMDKTDDFPTFQKSNVKIDRVDIVIILF